MAGMKRTKPNQVRDAVRFMLKDQKYLNAQLILEKAISQLRQAREWQTFKQIWQEPTTKDRLPFLVSDPYLSQHQPWRNLIGRVLSGCQDEVNLELWLDQCRKVRPLEPELVVMNAFVLICKGQYRAVQQSLEPLLGQLEGYWLGLAEGINFWGVTRDLQPLEFHLHWCEITDTTS
jgi:hypothetical protein